MTESTNMRLCVCGEPSCSGCSCGTDCSFSPGHPDGTHATDPLAALIKAARELLDNLASNEYYDDREQEPTCGQVSPDVRRLNATIAYAERNQQATQEALQGHLEEASTVIRADIKRKMACYLLAQSIPFCMEPLPEKRYVIRVSAEVFPQLQAEIGDVLEQGLVDDDHEMAWLRYRGALISYIEWKPGYTAEYHYRYATPEMDGEREFDIRDLSTFTEGNHHGDVIKRALDREELHPNAPFLQEPIYELWERS